MKKRLFSTIIISGFLAVSSLMPVWAEPADEAENNTNTVEAQQSDAANTEPQADTAEQEPSGPAAHAEAAILADMSSGKILFSKNPNERVYPASTTKILTGILVLENAQLSDVVTAPEEAITPITNKHSHMGILVGEELTVEQLLYGMLVYSANDAANVLAVHVAGSIDAFVQMMNDKAAELGASGTHFVNPHGFHDDNHYTTAADLLAISRYAMQNEKFREIVKTDMYTIPETNKYHEIRYLSSTNHLISRRRYANYFYDKAIGIKTGFTDEAGSCLVSAAVSGDTELISVVMKCANTTAVANGAYSFVDTKELFEYGFENFKHITVAAPGDIVSDSSVYEAKDNVRVAMTVENDISNILPVDYDADAVTHTITYTDEKVCAPIAKGDILGTISYEYKGEEIGTSNLVATNDVDKDYIIAVIHIILKIILNPIFLILLAAVIILRIRAKIIRNKRRRSRRSRLQHVSHDTEYKGQRKRR